MSATAASPGLLLARIDRIPVWALPSLFAGIIGIGFLVLAAIIAQFGLATRDRLLDEISP